MNIMANKKKIRFMLLAFFFLVVSIPAYSESPKKLVFLHYWSGDMSGGINEMVDSFNKKNPNYSIKAAGFDHETFKPSIKVMLEVGNPPDFFSYWAGAKTQDLVNKGYLAQIDDVWAKNDLSQKFGASITAACKYNGKIYALPVTQHYVAFFFNRSIFSKYNIAPPKKWDDFINICNQLKSKGITPIALGSREKWPAQFWFDYLLLRTAGPEFRQQLMIGEASYSDAKVHEAFNIWKNLINNKVFNSTPNALDWAEAAKMVYNGEAAMTLMGTWVSGLFESKLNWKQDTDYDFFTFPIIKDDIPEVAVGPIDCILIPAAKNSDAAKIAIGFFSEIEPQKAMSIGSGSIAPNSEVPEAFYTPMQARIRKAINRSAHWAFNYDLATPPEVAEIGLSSFSDFIANPEKMNEILAVTEKRAKEELKKTLPSKTHNQN